jgi:hypothetical protein
MAARAGWCTGGRRLHLWTDRRCCLVNIKLILKGQKNNDEAAYMQAHMQMPARQKNKLILHYF